MKRTIALILVLAICVSTMSLTVSATESMITVEQVAGNPGEQVEVKVSISGNAGLAYLKIKIGYDSDVLTLVSAKNSGLLEGTYTTSKTTDVNPYVLQWMGAGNSAGDGVIATLTFTIAETAEVGDTEITISFEECYDEEYNDVIFDTSAGSVTVECAHTSKTEVPAKSADCENDGNNLYYVCDSCGLVLKADSVTETKVENEIIPALGHDWIGADCDTPRTCDRCGETEGAVLGHSYTNYVSNNDATCDKDGTKTAKCDRCDETSTVTDEGSALGHDWIDADCDTPKTCDRCGTTEGDALGHNYSTEWSKGENGHWHECSACSDKTDEGEHDFGTAGDKCVICEYERSHVHRLTLVPAVDADCDTDGNKAYYTCSGCENWFEDASGSVLIADKTSVVITALGHDWIDADCDTPKTCDRCGETEGDALGHDWIDADCENPKTCSVCGETDGKALGHVFEDGICTACGEQEETEEPSKPVKPSWCNWFEKWFGSWWDDDEEDDCDHTYTAIVTDPTCTARGYTTHTCEHCGKTYTDSYVAATGHDYVGSVCSKCGHKKSGWFFWFDWFWKK